MDVAGLHPFVRFALLYRPVYAKLIRTPVIHVGEISDNLSVAAQGLNMLVWRSIASSHRIDRKMSRPQSLPPLSLPSPLIWTAARGIETSLNTNSGGIATSLPDIATQLLQRRPHLLIRQPL